MFEIAKTESRMKQPSLVFPKEEEIAAIHALTAKLKLFG
jgi:hypothetical protein